MDINELRKLIREELDDCETKPIDSGRIVSQSVPDVQRLRAIYHLFQDKEEFTPGDFVVWKDGLKNRRLPNYGQKGIVIQCLDEPIFDGNKESGSPYYREPLDIVVGFFDEDDDFMIFYYDSRRFTKLDVSDPHRS